MAHCSHLLVCWLLRLLVGRRVHCVSREAADKLIKLWDAYSGELVHTFEGHTEGISDIAWASDGEYLASASDDKTIMIWSIELVGILLSLLSITHP